MNTGVHVPVIEDGLFKHMNGEKMVIHPVALRLPLLSAGV